MSWSAQLRICRTIFPVTKIMRAEIYRFNLGVVNHLYWGTMFCTKRDFFQQELDAVELLDRAMAIVLLTSSTSNCTCSVLTLALAGCFP